jgi:hypothetical protein
MEKITKKQMFEGMVAYFKGEDTAISEAQFIEFCGAQIADLNKKAAKAKERAAAKKAEGDELTDLVYSVMTDEFQTGADIATAVLAQLPENTDVTAAKVTARITKLVNAEMVVKEQVSVEVEGKKSKKMAYKLAPADVEVDADEE